jgi:cell division protein FtsI (penicillin-binding protein 3)
MTTADAPFEDIADRPWGRFSGAQERLRQWFEKSHSAESTEDAVRMRIFFVMALFCAAFGTLALFAARASLFSGLDRGGAAGPIVAGARADLLDRNGEVLAMDIVRYGLYIRPRDVSDRAATEAAVTA